MTTAATFTYDFNEVVHLGGLCLVTGTITTVAATDYSVTSSMNEPKFALAFNSSVPDAPVVGVCSGQTITFYNLDSATDYAILVIGL